MFTSALNQFLLVMNLFLQLSSIIYVGERERATQEYSVAAASCAPDLVPKACVHNRALHIGGLSSSIIHVVL